MRLALPSGFVTLLATARSFSFELGSGSGLGPWTLSSDFAWTRAWAFGLGLGFGLRVSGLFLRLRAWDLGTWDSGKPGDAGGGVATYRPSPQSSSLDFEISAWSLWEVVRLVPWLVCGFGIGGLVRGSGLVVRGPGLRGSWFGIHGFWFGFRWFGIWDLGSGVWDLGLGLGWGRGRWGRGPPSVSPVLFLSGLWSVA